MKCKYNKQVYSSNKDSRSTGWQNCPYNVCYNCDGPQTQWEDQKPDMVDGHNGIVAIHIAQDDLNMI